MKIFAGYAAVFAVAAAVSAVIQAMPYFRDPDTFYHLKMAMLIREQGIIRSFPWLPYTTLAHDYADHHLLYHLLLIPFVSAFGPLRGMIAATMFFSAAAMTSFYGLLRAHAVRWPLAYVWILGTAAAFALRVNLGKAGAPSLAFIFLALIAIKKGRPAALFVISFLYVWLHGGWPIMLGVTGVALASKFAVDRIVGRHPWSSWAHTWFWRRMVGGSRHAWRNFFAAPEVRSATASVAGLGSGLVLNPYFPVNLRFYWEQTVQIALVGYRDRIGVGGEWYPYPFADLLTDSGGAFLAALISLALLAFVLFWPELVRRGRGTVQASDISALATSWLLMLIFLGMTLHSKRHVEYLLPFLVLAASQLITAVVIRLDADKARKKLSELLPNKRWAVPLLFGWLAAVFIYAGIKDVFVVRDLFSKGEPYGRYSASAAWLSSRAPQDAVILHSDWDDFPMLFFRDSGHRYIAGLDATFLYRADKAKYFLWRDITTGRITSGVAKTTKEVFGAGYAFVENDHQAMLDAFGSDPSAMQVYHDAEATIFIIL